MRGPRSHLFIIAILCLVSMQISVYPKPSHQKVDIREAEKLLANLGYWIQKVDGVADSSTRHSTVAFQKVEGLKRTGSLTTSVMKRLRLASSPEAKYKTGSAHVEVDLSRQVLFLTDDDGAVKLILPVSSGNEKKYFDQGKWQIAHTPRGQFKIIRRINGVRRAPLGNLYYPNYFVDGVAIHGSNSIPILSASHGCVRIPRVADKKLFAMTSLGMEVYVYD